MPENVYNQVAVSNSFINVQLFHTLHQKLPLTTSKKAQNPYKNLNLHFAKTQFAG